MPTTLEAFIILAFAIAPGFVAWVAVSAYVPRTFLSDVHIVVILFLLSVSVHVIVSPFTLYVGEEIAQTWRNLETVKGKGTVEINWIVFLWIATVLLVAPMIIGWGLGRVRSADRLQDLLEKVGLSQVQATPTAWDWQFLTKSQGCWVVAELDGNAYVAGEYGRNSFASLTPHGRDIYLESAYEVDKEHKIGERKPDTVGVWINGDKARAIYFYRTSENRDE